MAEVERRDKKPEPTEKKKSNGEGLSRREFLIAGGSGLGGLVAGGIIGREVLGKKAPPPEEVEEAAEKEEPQYKKGYTLVFDPYECTGCNLCAVACAEKWSEYLFPEETSDTVNLEFARIRIMRFQYVDVVNVCSYCKLEEWAEGSKKHPCAEVCPEDAIHTVPEGEGEEGYYGMGYKWIDRDKCPGADKCWRCAEICEDQFGSGISFDPIEKIAQSCSRCGGDPECVKACPEPQALRWVPAMRNGRYHTHQPPAFGELLYRKMFNTRRDL